MTCLVIGSAIISHEQRDALLEGRRKKYLPRKEKPCRRKIDDNGQDVGPDLGMTAEEGLWPRQLGVGTVDEEYQ